MADDETTLLKLKGDGSELRAEVAATRAAVAADFAAMQQLGAKGLASAGTLEAFGFSRQESLDFAAKQQTEELLTGSGAAAKRVQMLDAQAAAEHNVAQATLEQLAASEKMADALPARTEDNDDFDKSNQRASASLSAFGRTLGLVNPEMGQMVQILHSIGSASDLVFSPMGIAAGLTAAVIGALKSELAAAAEEAKRFADQMERIRQAGIEVEKSVSKALGEQGKGSEEAFTAGVGIANNLQGSGYEAGNASTVAAAIVDDAGQTSWSQEDQELLAAANASGQVTLGGKTANERRRNLARARRYVEKNRAALQQSNRAYQRPIVREAERATQQQSPTDIASILVQQGYSQEEAAQVARDAAEVAKRGSDEIFNKGFDDEGVLTQAWQYTSSQYRGLGRAVGVPSGESTRQARIRRAEEAQSLLPQMLRQRTPGGSGGSAPSGDFDSASGTSASGADFGEVVSVLKDIRSGIGQGNETSASLANAIATQPAPVVHLSLPGAPTGVVGGAPRMGR